MPRADGRASWHAAVEASLMGDAVVEQSTEEARICIDTDCKTGMDEN